MRFSLGLTLALALSCALIPPALAQDSAPAGPLYGLNPSGDGLVARAEGEDIALPFGTSRADIAKTSQKVWGMAVEESTMEECGAGPIGYLALENGVQLHFQDDLFVGWAMGGPGGGSGGPEVAPSGIAIGATRDALEAIAPGLQVFSSTLGTEFVTGDDVSGVLSGPKDGAVIDHLWAGVSCNFR